MNRHEVAALLAYVDRLDPGRAPTDKAAAGERLIQWATLLEHVPSAAQHPDGRHWDASRIAVRHIATSPYPIKPSDIGRPWEAYRADVIGRHYDPAPAVDPDNEAAYRAALRSTRHAVAVGALPPTPQHAIEGRPSPIRAVRDAAAARRLAELGTYVPREVADDLADFRPRQAVRESLAANGLPDPLDVDCPYEQCRARAGKPCQGGGKHRFDRAPHPSRLDAATVRHYAQETAV
ncbi:cell surface glycoprotein [Streptomyces sp. NPDC016459]|uniref:zinc finger domain-containing protein n=1 Tax=Streptomyces sp. NPDC016459 TaxID=3157190 RepID=UPI0033C7D5DC